jgi:hypothetical protein
LPESAGADDSNTVAVRWVHQVPSSSPGTVGRSRPDATLIVEWTIGSPNDLAVFTGALWPCA